MTNKRITGVLLIVFVSVTQLHTFPDLSAIVNEPLSLPCTCSGPVVEWIIFSPVKDSIARCHDGVCEIESPFQKRFSFLGNTSNGNFSISINSTLYNDLGMYRCTCNEVPVSEGKLHVYDPRIVTASEGDNITLPCYGDTRRDAKDVQWKKDGESLLEYTYPKQGEASAGRFSVSEKGFQDGNLSLRIDSVNLSDAGLYRCLIHGESREGDPRAVRLTVKKGQQEDQQHTTFQSCILHIATEAALTLVLVIIVGVIVYVKVLNRPQDETPKNSVQEEFPMIPKPSSTQPIYDS